MEKILIYKVKSIKDFFFLRKVRNLNLKFFTENKKYLSVFQQIYFYFFLSKKYKIYIIKKNNKNAGYLLLKKHKKVYFITQVILKEYRRQNLGTQIVDFAKKRYNNLVAKIFLSNKRSIYFHKKLGFKILKKEKKIIYLNYKRA
jgi:putative acetyltransferase